MTVLFIPKSKDILLSEAKKTNITLNYDTLK